LESSTNISRLAKIVGLIPKVNFFAEIGNSVGIDLRQSSYPVEAF